MVELIVKPDAETGSTTEGVILKKVNATMVEKLLNGDCEEGFLYQHDHHARSQSWSEARNALPQS